MRHYELVWTRVLAGLAVVAAVGAVAVVYIHPPTPDALYPRCLLYASTGIYCPGCGGTRAAYHLMNGQIGQAARSNLIVVIVAPIAALYWFAAARFAVTGRWGLPDWGRRVGIFILIAATVFTILRNLPWFSDLAPDPLMLTQPK